MVPSGQAPNGKMLPTFKEAFTGVNKLTSVDTFVSNESFFSQFVYGSLKATLANGAPLPGSWMICLTTPRM